MGQVLLEVKTSVFPVIKALYSPGKGFIITRWRETWCVAALSFILGFKHGLVWWTVPLTIKCKLLWDMFYFRFSSLILLEPDQAATCQKPGNTSDAIVAGCRSFQQFLKASSCSFRLFHTFCCSFLFVLPNDTKRTKQSSNIWFVSNMMSNEPQASWWHQCFCWIQLISKARAFCAPSWRKWWILG